ncbi:carbohydrate porin [Asticcacaulis endophyticus]|uniref:Porin n=1 Tax=Asticcacaulis endophyticus TaxID=1395890 RepID=A0A918QAF1_9CAUL|nr:carbohydrate porin [Asticcacaulis endophyticus]GGZ39671.1 porin [Asticcacaulis endophyticus]
MFRASAFRLTCVLVALAASGTARAEIEYDAVLTTDLLHNKSGGLREGSRVMSNLDLSAAWQGPSNWDGFAYVLADAGGGFSERYSGDAQVVSNIDAPKGVRLFEAWVRRTAESDRWSVTGGLINLNGIFDVQEAGALFLNASHGIGPDYSQTGPSIFPFAALGVVGDWQATDTLRLRGGLFDGVAGDPSHQSRFIGIKLSEADGAHWVVEAEQNFSRGYVKVGAWGYTAETERLDGSGPSHANRGQYVQVKYDFYRPDPESDRGLSAWLRWGQANEDVQAIETYIGGGLVWTAPLAGRDSDAVGIAIAKADLGTPYAAAQGVALKPETALELSYRYAIRDGLSVQPDIQYVQNPSGDPDTKGALVLGVRLRVGLQAFD